MTEAVNPRLHGLLRRFEDLTGVPVLLNTSFNDAGEPIVCTPADALRTFLRTGLDVLVLGDYVVQRREQLSDAAAQEPHASSWNV